jgi:uncharacterized protein YbjT (DUF2867 family)
MYIVAGATGNTGSVVAETLLQQGKPVTVIARSHEKGQPWKAKGAKIAVGSFEQPETITAALKNGDGAYLLIPPASGVAQESREGIVRSLAQAVEKSGVKHVVILSSIGAQHPSGTGPIVSAYITESALSPVAKNLTIIRAAYFFENWAPVLPAAQNSGVLPTFLTTDRRIPMVATRDIGLTAADALLNPAQGRRIIELAGPQDYSPDDIASALSSLLNREVRVQHLPLSAAVETFKGMGFPEDVARVFEEMYAAINSGRVSYEGGSAEFRRGAASARETLKHLLGQSARAQAGA